MNEEEQEAIEVLESFEYREKTKQYNKLDLGDVRTSKVLLNLINRLQEIIKKQSYTNKKLRNKIKTVRKERNKLQKELDKIKKVEEENENR